MDYEFKSKKELYDRVSPALHAKEAELHRLGYNYIKGVDVWNYLIEHKWKQGKNLMLSDIVSDIMNTDCSKIDSYLKDKLSETKRTQYFDKNIEEII